MDCITQNAVIGILSFLAGGVITHRFSLFRDMRKEFNAVSEHAFIGLSKQGRGLARGEFPTAIYDYSLVEAYISPWRRRAFREAVERHHANHQDVSSYDPQFGSAEFDANKVKQLLASNQKLLKYLKRR